MHVCTSNRPLLALRGETAMPSRCASGRCRGRCCHARRGSLVFLYGHLLLVFIIVFLLLVEPVASAVTGGGQRSGGVPHQSNYAIVLSSSRYWFNYRHTSNALSVYQILKQYGDFHDDDIVLMLADEWSVNPRNPAKNHIYNTATDGLDGLPPRSSTSSPPRPSLLTADTIVDYRSEDVTVEQFLTVLLNAPTDATTNILIYINGHGGDQFFKFQDVEEVMTVQLADVLLQMHLANQYHQILFVADTCQAFTLADGIIQRNIPNVAVIGSSLKGQSSYAHTSNPILGLSVIEKYTHYFSDRVERSPVSSSSSFMDQSVRSFMVEGYAKQRLGNAELGLWDASCTPHNMTTTPMRNFWQQKKKKQQQQQPTRRTAARKKHVDDSAVVRVLTPLPTRLVWSFPVVARDDVVVVAAVVGEAEEKMDIKTVCQADQSADDGECPTYDNTTTIRLQQQYDGLDDDETMTTRPPVNVVEPTSLLFLFLVMALVAAVAFGSTYL